MNGSGVREVPLTRGIVALVDEADWHRELSVTFVDGRTWRGTLAEPSWFAVVRGAKAYAGSKVIGKADLSLHRAIMCAGVGQIVDHIDGNGLNNRRSNLRFATQQQNCQNRRAMLGCSSRFKGVSFVSASGRWHAYIKHNQKRTHLGFFDDEEAAARAYDEAARLFFGEYAKLNFPLEGVL